ncbi:MAG: AAA family ATPase [Xanthomonadaceae bacterium]|jgi:AAA+ superfamily predicted ATPase|nr:AAA family ATPase [Xanthomonadaceae bacterium]
MSEVKDLATLIRAGTGLIVIETPEETRAVETFRHVFTQVMRPLWRWSLTDGLKRLDMDDDGAEVPPDATATLMAIKQHPERGVYLLLDFHGQLRYAMTLRLLREIVERQGSAAHTLVLISPKVELPPDLAALHTRFSLRLPDAAALAKMVREEAFAYSREHQGKRVEVDAAAMKAIVRNLAGLSLADARGIVRQLIFRDGAICQADLPQLAKLKFELLNRDGVLHFEYDTAQFADVAGMARLKDWVAKRRAVFLGDNPPPGLDPPKGVLLLGVQGSGKSLAAKALAGGFGVPLVRLDFGSMYNKFHGETERNLRESLKSAESLQPCVLWIDEIEKGLATSTSDDGVSKRVLGYLLTWMAERKAKVFLVATANAVHELPPELLRKGRFDEIFFVDLPSAPVRAEIFRIHLGKRKARVEAFDLDALAAASEGFSGAEIEQAVVGALYAAHADGGALDPEHVLAEIRNTRPLSVLMAEQVQGLREWARSRTVPAD